MSSGRGQKRGMVALDGITYRIERLASKTYAVIRVSDDLNVGTFKTAPEFAVLAEHIEPALLEMIARRAIKTAKTSWVGHAIPKSEPPPAPEPESKPDAETPVDPRRRWAPA